MSKIVLNKIVKLKNDSKKYEAEFKKGNKTIKRKFGASGMSDYTKHKDTFRRNNYIKRHKKDLRTNDPTRAGFLSMYILWNKKTYKASLADYKKRLNTYNKTGKFPKKIKDSVLNKFGGKEIESLKTVLDERKIKYSEDIIENINKQLQVMKIQEMLSKNLKIKKDKKIMFRGLIEQYLSPDYEYEYGDEYPWDVSDEETQMLIIDAYLTSNQNDLNDDLFREFLIKIRDSFNNLFIRNYNSQQKANVFLSRYYFMLLLKKLKIKDSVLNKFGESKIPDNVINKKLYSKIKKKIQKDVKKKKRRWGAYDSGRLVREYKKDGGKYKSPNGKSPNEKSKLDRWYREKWIDACKWPKKSPCGRSKAKQKLTYCRPSIKVNSKTPITIQELTKEQIKSRCKRKKNNNLKIIRN